MTDKLQKQLADIESKICYNNYKADAISKSSVGWHIEHLLLTINSIIKVLKNSHPENYKKKNSFLKTIVFISKKIPRGKAKAPKFVTPSTFDAASLKIHVVSTKTNVEQLKNISLKHYFSHPYFGDLQLQKAIQFIQIHNKHHLKIIDDIIKSTN